MIQAQNIRRYIKRKETSHWIEFHPNLKHSQKGNPRRPLVEGYFTTILINAYWIFMTSMGLVLTLKQNCKLYVMAIQCI